MTSASQLHLAGGKQGSDEMVPPLERAKGEGNSLSGVRVGLDSKPAHAPIIRQTAGVSRCNKQKAKMYMSAENPVDWAAALAEVEAKIVKLQTMADGIREMMAAAGVAPHSPSGGGPNGGGVRPDAFLGMSIADATKKHLENVRQKQSTQEIIDALQRGGLPPSKYNTVYGVLNRRERNIGDIVNMKGDWGLASWYPNHTRKAKKGASANGGEVIDVDDEATA